MKPESFKSSQSESEPNKESLDEQYRKLLMDYHDKFVELERMQRRYPAGIIDPEVKSIIQIMDQERHQIHLQLIEVGAKMGKNKNNVLVDIVQTEGSLEEYDLPEFSIMTKEKFLVGDELEDDEVLIVFDAKYGDEFYSDDYDELKKRAENLAREAGGEARIINEDPELNSPHQARDTLGVVIKKEDLEKVAAIIRNNPKKFRIRREFLE